VFLTLLQRRNPALLAAAAALHQAGDLPPNTYVLDLATIEQNAAALAAESSRLGLTPFAMTKQIGRNPDASRAVRAGGITHAVGVDLECAVAAAHGGLAVGHLGHLVQIPRAQAPTAARLAPSYWTVFSEQKAQEAAAAAHEIGRTQDLLVRVSAPGDRFYTGHEGGVDAGDIVAVADRIDALPGARFAGVTTFPATLFDAATGRASSTPNLRTLSRAAQALRAAGRDRVELNAPGTTSVSVLATLAEAGATQVEPGHGLTGTTPLHAVEDLVEAPAVAYVSEVSHVWNDTAYVFGGGLYVDPVLGGSRTEALVLRRGAGLSEAHRLVVDMPAPEAIDYYARIPLGSDTVEPGDTVLFGFRPQVFVTRGLTAGLRDLDSTPRVVGTWSANGSAHLAAPDLTSARSKA
jgi:predicted amino acid racemase